MGGQNNILSDFCIYYNLKMSSQQNFRDKFKDYLSRRINPNEAQNIVYRNQKSNSKQDMQFLSPPYNRYQNQSLASPPQSSINSSVLTFTNSNKSHRTHGQTTSIKKKRLIKLKQIQENVCSICLEHYKNRIKMSCGHYFCYECIQQWLSTSSRCPYCRTDCQYYTINGKKIQIEQKQYQYEPEQVDDGLDFQCYMCQQTNEGDQVLICDGCGLYACHIRCDPRLRGRVPDDEQPWFCHFC